MFFDENDSILTTNQSVNLIIYTDLKVIISRAKKVMGISYSAN